MSRRVVPVPARLTGAGIVFGRPALAILLARPSACRPLVDHERLLNTASVLSLWATLPAPLLKVLVVDLAADPVAACPHSTVPPD